MNNFKYSEKYQTYIYNINKVIICCDEPAEKYEKKASVIAKKYKNTISSIVDFIYEDVTEMFGEMSKEIILNSLGTPLINIQSEVITYLDHTLDQTHIIEIEYSNDLEKFHYVTIDG